MALFKMGSPNLRLPKFENFNLYLCRFVQISFHVVWKAKSYFGGGLLSQHFFIQNVWDKKDSLIFMGGWGLEDELN